MAFDPYYKWLGIPPEEQPPSYYRLLGIPPFEDDPDVIEAAAYRQMSHVRSYAGGAHSDLSQQLLNELSAAQICLFDATKKAKYDKELAQSKVLELRTVPERTSRVINSSKTLASEPTAADEVEIESDSLRLKKTNTGFHSTLTTLQIGICISIAVLVLWGVWKVVWREDSLGVSEGKTPNSTLSEREKTLSAIVEKNAEHLSPKSPEPSISSTETGAIAPFDATKAREYQQAAAMALGVEVDLTNSMGMKLKLIPAGKFMMGSAITRDLNPVHEVTITKPFYLGVYEVTQEQYEGVMGENPSKFKGPQHPVEGVSWHDAVEFCYKLGEKEGRTYRLPTEAEWEYACRAGTTTAYSFGDEKNQLGDYAWCSSNAGSKSHPIGQKLPNPWGLFDMHGNVWEWCQDERGSKRVNRGGSWSSNARSHRSSLRNADGPTFRDFRFGFRVATVPPSKGAAAK